MPSPPLRRRRSAALLWRGGYAGVRTSRKAATHTKKRGSVTRLHGRICAVHRQPDRRLVVYERTRIVHWLRPRTWCDRIQDTRLAVRKRRDPARDSLEGLSIEWSPPTSRGECRQMRTHYTTYRTAPNNNLVAMFGHRSIFYCDFSPFRSSKKGGYPTIERGVSLQVYEAVSSLWAHATGLSLTRPLWTPTYLIQSVKWKLARIYYGRFCSKINSNLLLMFFFIRIIH